MDKVGNRRQKVGNTGKKGNKTGKIFGGNNQQPNLKGKEF